MASYHDLIDFQHGLIVGAREMGHSISEVEEKFGFSRTTVSRVYREYKNSGKTSAFNAGPSTNISVRTVQRSLQDMSFRSQRPIGVPLMNTGPTATRLAWAQEHHHWTLDWKQVAWSEEQTPSWPPPLTTKY
uniref:Transposase Tc1-like domain-containing protein n=1 Tax=Esox lucius TaxID=8010 RepID=A0A6Q2XWL8_ESOLU